MPILPKNWDLDLDLVNILIKKEREERERQNNVARTTFFTTSYTRTTSRT
jgi:hypothetical protein